MLSHRKWARTGLVALMVVALLSGGLAWAAKPPKPPPEPPPPPPVTYELTWLDGFAYSGVVRALNAHGHVVGRASSPDMYGGAFFAFLYTPETGMIDLNTLLPQGSGWRLKYAEDINDLGQIAAVGEPNGQPIMRAVRFTPAVIDGDGTVLQPAVVEEMGPVTPDDENNVAVGINNSGDVCGRAKYEGPLGVYRIMWFYSDATGFETVLPEMNLFPITINNSAVILGREEDAGNVLFRVTPGGTPDFFHSPVGDTYGITANDMNDDGVVVGHTALYTTLNHKKVIVHWGAYRYDGESFFELGAHEARGINNQGDVVGIRLDGSGFIRLESSRTMVNLDDAVTGDPDDLGIWFDDETKIYPERINDSGQIAGYAYFGLVRSSQAFLLTPVPSGN